MGRARRPAIALGAGLHMSRGISECRSRIYNRSHARLRDDANQKQVPIEGANP